MPKQLVAVDVHVADYKKLIDQLGDQYQFLVLTSESDALTQLADFVSTNPGFAAIHLISHGASGEIQLGSQTISGANVGRYAEQLSHIGAGVTPGGDFLLYGCDVAQGMNGQQFITNLAQLTRLDVAASTNKTGSQGDWVLEASRGQIEHVLPAISYALSLAHSGPTVAWTRLIGSTGFEYAGALTTGLDGSIYLAGYTDSETLDGQITAGEGDAFITKFAADGTKAWTKLIGSTGSEYALALTTALDGSIYLAGYTFGSEALDGRPNAGADDAFITKFAADGTKVWTKLIGSTGFESSNALTTGLDGSIYLAGYTDSETLDGQISAGEGDAFITNFAADGTKVWTKLIGSTGFEYASELTTSLDGSIYLAGFTDSETLDGQTNAGASDAFITKFRADGTKVWTKLIGSTGVQIARALTTGLDGSIYLAGYTFGSEALDGQTIAGVADAFVVKLVDESSGVGGQPIRGTASDDVLVGGDGDDSIVGDAGNDSIYGGDGDDSINGGEGDDSIEGGDGNDSISGGGGNAILDGGSGNDYLEGGAMYGSQEEVWLRGGDGNDTLIGGGGSDTLDGGAGNDTLVGGAANDLLTGGDGADRFVFDATLGAANIDTITDFVTKTNKIVLSAKVFNAFKGSSAGSAITAGNLVVGAGATAQDKDDYLIYDTTTGLLYYDADGNGSGAAVAFAKVELTGAAAPAFGDFLVVV
jgi:Ca2+-binding RTX toxin-like protein